MAFCPEKYKIFVLSFKSYHMMTCLWVQLDSTMKTLSTKPNCSLRAISRVSTSKPNNIIRTIFLGLPRIGSKDVQWFSSYAYSYLLLSPGLDWQLMDFMSGSLGGWQWCDTPPGGGAAATPARAAITASTWGMFSLSLVSRSIISTSDEAQGRSMIEIDFFLKIKTRHKHNMANNTNFFSLAIMFPIVVQI